MREGSCMFEDVYCNIGCSRRSWKEVEMFSSWRRLRKLWCIDGFLVVKYGYYEDYVVIGKRKCLMKKENSIYDVVLII